VLIFTQKKIFEKYLKIKKEENMKCDVHGVEGCKSKGCEIWKEKRDNFMEKEKSRPTNSGKNPKESEQEKKLVKK